MTNYKFMGYDWLELAECWDLKAEPKISDWMRQLYDEGEEVEGVPEKIDITIDIAGTKICVTTSIVEEVLREKIIRHIKQTMMQYGKPEDQVKQMRYDINRFLAALIEEEYGYSAGVYQAIMEIENDHTFAQWIVKHLGSLWT